MHQLDAMAILINVKDIFHTFSNFRHKSEATFKAFSASFEKSVGTSIFFIEVRVVRDINLMIKIDLW